MRFIPNEETWIGFATSLTGTKHAPKKADIDGAVELTPAVMGLTASTTGQTVPTPAFDTLFEESIPGTVQAQFSMDAYRYTDPDEDVVWNTLPRKTSGYILVARYGGKPTTGDEVEVWPIRVTSRSVPNMTSNTAVQCTVTAAVPDEPDEEAVIVA